VVRVDALVEQLAEKCHWGGHFERSEKSLFRKTGKKRDFPRQKRAEGQRFSPLRSSNLSGLPGGFNRWMEHQVEV
jgi:hypothetical protein